MVLIFKAGSKNVFYQEIFLVTVCATDGQIEYKTCTQVQKIHIFLYYPLSDQFKAPGLQGCWFISHDENCLLKKYHNELFLTKRHNIVDKMLLE